MTVTAPAPATAPEAPPPASPPLPGGRSKLLVLLLLVAGMLGAVLLSFAIGSRSIPLATVLDAFFAYDPASDDQTIVRELRVPRTELAILVGAALGGAGALMQGTTRNPLAEPGILGINAGAAFAVVVAISAFSVSSIYGWMLFALAGAGITAVLVFALGMSGRGAMTPVRLALAGAVLTWLLVALTSAVLVFDARTLDEFRFWIVGSLAGRDDEITLAVLPLIAVGLVLALGAAKWMNGLALGDDVARALGQNVVRTRAVASIAFVLLAGGAVAAAGPIAFVGLAVPHIARFMVGPDYRWIIPYSVVLGAVVLLCGDVLGRVIVRPGELEVGIVTAFVGAPFFIWLVRRRRITAL